VGDTDIEISSDVYDCWNPNRSHVNKFVNPLQSFGGELRALVSSICWLAELTCEIDRHELAQD
jgi:hypothetical protein